MMYARSLLFVVWLYGSMTVCGIIGAPFSAFRTSAAVVATARWARAALFGARWICGIRAEIRVPAAPALFAIKHQAMLDTLMPFFLTRSPSIVEARIAGDADLRLVVRARVSFRSIAKRTLPALKAMLRAARAEYQKRAAASSFFQKARASPLAHARLCFGVAAIYRDLGAPCVPVALNSGVRWPAHGLCVLGLVTLEILDAIPPGLSREDTHVDAANAHRDGKRRTA